jgi:hypothetical protein
MVYYQQKHLSILIFLSLFSLIQKQVTKDKESMAIKE